jgi:hypothetical protein
VGSGVAVRRGVWLTTGASVAVAGPSATSTERGPQATPINSKIRINGINLLRIGHRNSLSTLRTILAFQAFPASLRNPNGCERLARLACNLYAWGKDCHRKLSPANQEEAMTDKPYITQDRDEIIQWAERRDAHAAKVVGVHPDAADIDEDTQFNPDIGALRLGFPGYASMEQLEPMTWDEWFEAFEEANLQFAYSLWDEDGNPTNDYELTS